MQTLKSAFMRVAFFCDHWDWVLLALAAPFLLFPSPTRSLALLVVPGLWITRWLASKQPLPRTPFNLTLLLMAVMVLVSLYATYDINVSLPKITGIVLGISTFFVFVRYSRQPGGWWLCFFVFLATGVGVAGLGIMGTNWLMKVGFLTPILSHLPPRITGLPGAESGFSGNELAGALLWTIPLLVALAALALIHFEDLQSAFGWRRAAAAVALLVGNTLLVIAYFTLTQSRGGYIGLALAIIAMTLVVLPFRWRWLLGSVIIVVIILGIIIIYSGNSSRVNKLFGANASGDPALSLDTLEGRAEVWSRAVYGIQDFPFTGMGMNTFRKVVHVLYPLFFTSPEFDISHAHNEFLQAALDLGIPGLIGFVALYVGAYHMLAQVWRAASILGFNSQSANFGRLLRALALGFGVGLGGHIVYGLTDVVALGAKPGVLFWMMLGLIAALFEQAESERFIQWQNWMHANVPFHRNTPASQRVSNTID